MGTNFFVAGCKVARSGSAGKKLQRANVRIQESGPETAQNRAIGYIYHMNRNVLRQLKDVNAQADNLLSGHPDKDAFVAFGRYANELKAYLLEHETEPLVLERAVDIPDLEAFTISRPVKASALAGAVTILSLGLIPATRIQQMRKEQEQKEMVREIQGKFSSIQFFLKNIYE